SLRRQPCATTAPATNGRTSSHGGGAAPVATACAGGVALWPGCSSAGCSRSPGRSPGAARSARVEAIPVRAAPSATAAAAPTAALPISVRRESIAHLPLGNEGNRAHGLPDRARPANRHSFRRVYRRSRASGKSFLDADAGSPVKKSPWRVALRPATTRGRVMVGREDDHVTRSRGERLDRRNAELARLHRPERERSELVGGVHGQARNLR